MSNEEKILKEITIKTAKGVVIFSCMVGCVAAMTPRNSYGVTRFLCNVGGLSIGSMVGFKAADFVVDAIGSWIFDTEVSNG